MPNVPVPSAVSSSPRRIGRGWFVLSVWLQGLLWASLVLSLDEHGAAWWTFVLARGWYHDPASYSDAADAHSSDLVWWSGNLQGMVVLASGVLFICWLYQAHRSDRVDPDRRRHASGWAIGGWFVPVLWFWRPFQMVVDTEQAAGHTDEVRRPRRLVLWWWLLFILGQVAEVVTVLLDNVDDYASNRDYGHELWKWAITDIVATAIWAAAALLAIRVVRQVTRTVGQATPR